jgi:UDP-N-acetylglucosamine diphosphorylase / glucose-1-phosphate thymidylyltransferase / UDP-N-acetylgalactosamine diphosphorylase / glucosamine-1-phosphate N-acetyltransferase / galactosamine-1-phosphate N-acetyltransferase
MMVDKVLIPSNLPRATSLVASNFPSIRVEEYEDTSTVPHANEPSRSSSLEFEDRNSVIAGLQNFEVPINSFIYYSIEKGLLVDSMVYPWHFLDIVQKTLRAEVTRTRISPAASVARTSIIEGPCVIEDDVIIDDFCKIKGPTYISKGSHVGMSSLVRNCMFGRGTRIGFNCEIAKSYFAGNAKISHQNVILDSIIGENVWFGGYSGTANVLLSKKNIKYEILTEFGEKLLLDTSRDHFGAVVGENCAIGASVIILPGRQIPQDTVIQAGTIYGLKHGS